MTKARRRAAGFAAAVTVSLAVGGIALPAGAARAAKPPPKLSVVASFYPLAEAASRVGIQT